MALDCEAAGFHRYSDRVCLIQVTVRASPNGAGTFLVDPLAFDPSRLLAPVAEDRDRELIMHGADYDIRLLDRDLGIRLQGLFDTQIAAQLLGVHGPSLSKLLEVYLGVEVPKKHQRADWAERPLPQELVEYAAEDTRYLHDLRDRLAAELEEKGRLAWAREEFRFQEEVRFQDTEGEDPVTRVKAARDLPVRQVALLREALAWRDEVARARDRAPFRVASDEVLIRVVQAVPSSTEALAGVKGFSSRLAQEWGRDLLDRLRTVLETAEDELEPYPSHSDSAAGRPAPEEEERMNRLKKVRNAMAEDLGLERGVLLPNHLLRAIAGEAPGDEGDLRKVPGIRRWQVEVLGPDLLSAI